MLIEQFHHPLSTVVLRGSHQSRGDEGCDVLEVSATTCQRGPIRVISILLTGVADSNRAETKAPSSLRLHLCCMSRRMPREQLERLLLTHDRAGNLEILTMFSQI